MTTLKPTAELAARHAIAERVGELFAAHEALRRGHFRDRDGRHFDAYLRTTPVLEDPKAVEALAAFLAGPFLAPDDAPRVDVVAAGASAGSAILGLETARRLGIRLALVGPGGAPAIGRGARVLVVVELVRTGGSLLDAIASLERAGGEILEVAAVVDRSGGMASLTSPETGRVYPLRGLWRLDQSTWDAGPDTCPGCAAGEPLTITGG